MIGFGCAARCRPARPLLCCLHQPGAAASLLSQVGHKAAARTPPSNEGLICFEVTVTPCRVPWVTWFLGKDRRLLRGGIALSGESAPTPHHTGTGLAPADGGIGNPPRSHAGGRACGLPPRRSPTASPAGPAHCTAGAPIRGGASRECMPTCACSKGVSSSVPPPRRAYLRW